jgi:antitoxin component YwqK of YwqJK toxin-antitoxin module
MVLSNPDNGKLIYRTKWKDGKQDGDVIRYTLDGKYPLYKGRLVDGKRNGVEEIYHPTTHKLITELNWDNGIKNGSEKRWSDDGSVLLADLHWLLDTKESGFEKEMDATGAKLLTDLTWKSGKATGFKTVIHADSGILSYYDEYHIKDDLFDGVHKRYERGNLDGKDIIFLSEVSNFKKGKLDGRYQKINSNGMVWNQMNYKDDLKDGLYQWFDSNGKIQDERTYKDGVEIMMPIPAGPDVNYEKCINSWIVARRIESGSEISLASISGSEFIELKNWCEQGKTPTSH